MEGVFEADDGRAARVGAGDLDRVLHGFGASVHEDGLLAEIAGDQPIELFRQLDVVRIGDHAKTGVKKSVRLIADGRNHLRGAVAYVDAADAAGEIQQAIAVDVLDDCAFGMRGKNGRGGRNSSGNGSHAPPREIPGARAGDRGTQFDCGHLVSTSRSVARSD